MFKLIRRSISLLVFLICLVSWLILSTLIVLGVSTWYKYQDQANTQTWGLIWSNKKALSYNLDPVDDLDSLLNQTSFNNLQLNTYWDELEPQNNTYNFKILDEQFKIAQDRNLKISLQLGLHQSFGNYCHQPLWTNQLDRPEFINEFKDYLRAIIDRYDNSEVLVQYQLEPEIFNVDQAECSNYLDQRELQRIYGFLVGLTSKDISLSYNLELISYRSHPLEPTSLGLSLDLNPEAKLSQIIKRLPSGYYTWQAGSLKLINRDSSIFIRKLNLITSDSVLTIDDSEVIKRLTYGYKTKIKTIYLNGFETILHNDNQALIQTIKTTIETELK